MNTFLKQAFWILLGVFFIFILKINIKIPYVNILLGLFCFYKAFSVNKKTKVIKKFYRI